MSEVLTTAAQTYGQSVREAVRVLSGALKQKRLYDLRGTLLPSYHFQSGLTSVRPDAEVAAWDLVSMWLTGVATNNLLTKATLREAEEWFLAKDKPQKLTDLLSVGEISEAQRALPSGVNTEVCHELLPYIFDPHGPGSRLSVKRDPRTRAARVRKRAEGVFYTPADVAEYMVSGCLDSLDNDSTPTVYDPACGTGVFLRAALRELRRRYRERSIFSIASECLFGTDIAPWPLDAAAFVLLADILVSESELQESPGELWSRLRLNLGCIDALLVEPVDASVGSSGTPHNDASRVSLSKLFPALKEEPMVIVGNPPYADLGDPPYAGELVRLFKTLGVKPRPTAEIYVAFVEQMIRLANRERCAGSVVLPLSIASNVGRQFVAARQLIQETAGEWRFAFFDREPQALFGEDVKTRNAIIFWNRNSSATNPAIASGPLRRWRGESRAAMFDSIGFTRIPGDIQEGIPKIEGNAQVSALETLNGRCSRLEQAVHGIKRINLVETPGAGDNVVFVGSTAYNFLNVFLRPPQSIFENGLQLSENQLYAIQCATSEDASAVFGILTSHLAYWWWHAHGDGFHVLRRFLADFPFGKDVLGDQRIDLLFRNGSALWLAMNPNPTMSLNRGRTSLAYNPSWYTDMRRSADQVLIDVAGLDENLVDELQRFTEQTIAAKPRYNTHR